MKICRCLKSKNDNCLLFIIISPVVEILRSCNSYKVLYILIRFCRDIYIRSDCVQERQFLLCLFSSYVSTINFKDKVFVLFLFIPN